MNLRFVKWDFPGGPVIKDLSLTLHFITGNLGSIPGQEA